MSRITERGATGPLSLTANGQFQQQAQSLQVYGGTATDTSLSTLLGSRWDLQDGREVRFVLAGSSNLAAGKLMMSPAIIANHQNLTVTAVQSYSNNGNVPATVTVTLGGTAVTANQYAGGYLVVNDNTGEGQTLQIASHPAQATTTGNVTITLADGPNTALDTTSQVCLIPAACNGVVIFDHSNLGSPVGVALYPITAAYYGFITSKGTTSCLADSSTITAGLALQGSTATDGAIEAQTASTNVATGPYVGHAVQAGVSTEYRTIYVNL